jgi:hypothetical protein
MGRKIFGPVSIAHDQSVDFFRHVSGMATPVSYTLNVARCMSFCIQRNGNSASFL